MIQPNVYVIHEDFDGDVTKHHGGVERVDRLRAIGVITGIITMQLDPTKRDVGADIDKALLKSDPAGWRRGFPLVSISHPATLTPHRCLNRTI